MDDRTELERAAAAAAALAPGAWHYDPFHGELHGGGKLLAAVEAAPAVGRYFAAAHPGAVLALLRRPAARAEGPLAEAWLRLVKFCADVGLPERPPGLTACEQVLAFLKREYLLKRDAEVRCAELRDELAAARLERGLVIDRRPAAGGGA